MKLPYEIGIAEPSPSLGYVFRSLTGEFSDAVKLAKTFFEVEGRQVIVVCAEPGCGHSHTPCYTIR